MSKKTNLIFMSLTLGFILTSCGNNTPATEETTQVVEKSPEDLNKEDYKTFCKKEKDNYAELLNHLSEMAAMNVSRVKNQKLDISLVPVPCDGKTPNFIVLDKWFFSDTAKVNPYCLYSDNSLMQMVQRIAGHSKAPAPDSSKFFKDTEYMGWKFNKQDIEKIKNIKYFVLLDMVAMVKPIVSKESQTYTPGQCAGFVKLFELNTKKCLLSIPFVYSNSEEIKYENYKGKEENTLQMVVDQDFEKNIGYNMEADLMKYVAIDTTCQYAGR